MGLSPRSCDWGSETIEQAGGLAENHRPVTGVSAALWPVFSTDHRGARGLGSETIVPRGARIENR